MAPLIHDGARIGKHAAAARARVRQPDASVAPARQVIAEQPAAVLVLVAIDAEVLPVAAVGRVVVVVAVLVVDGEKVEIRGFELASALRANPAVQAKGLLAVAEAPHPRRGLRVADQLVDVLRGGTAATGGSEAPRRHPLRILLSRGATSTGPPSAEAEALELLGRRVELHQRRPQEVEHAALGRRLAGAVLLLVRVDAEIVEVMTADDPRARRPEGQEIAGAEGLADDRDRRAGHVVQNGPMVRPGQGRQP